MELTTRSDSRYYQEELFMMSKIENQITKYRLQITKYRVQNTELYHTLK